MTNPYGHSHTRTPEQLKHLFTESQWNLIQENSKRNYISNEKILLSYLCKLKYLSSYETGRLLGVSSQAIRDYLKIAEQTYISSRKLNYSIKKLLEPEKPLEDMALQAVQPPDNAISGALTDGLAQMTAKPSTIYNSPSISPLLPSHEDKTNAEQAPISNSSPPMTEQKEAAEQQEEPANTPALTDAISTETTTEPKPKRWVNI